MKLSLTMTGCCYPIKDAKDQKGLLSKPRRNRGCTDILVFLVFVFFICGLIFLGAFSISKGDPFRLVYGTDSFGNTCDEDNSKRAITGVSYSGRNLKGRPYLFFMNIKEPDSSMRICVNKCPENDILTPRELYDFSQQTGSLLCRYDLDLSVYVTANGSLQGPCPVLPIHKSESLLNWCIPRDMVEIDGWQENNIANNVIAYINKSNVFQKVLRDLYASWTVLTALCFLAVAFSVLMVLLIRFLASVIIWLILTLAVLASMAGSAFIWWTFISNKNKLDMEETLRVPLLEVDINSENSFLLFSVVSTVLTIILLLILVAMRKRISHVVLLLKEAGSCVSELPLLLLQPLWTLLLLIMFFVYWVTVLAYLSTSDQTNQMVPPEVSDGLMFCEHHIAVLIHFIRDKSQLGFPILGTIGRLIVFHQGSVAFGSLLTLVKLPKMMLLFITKKLKSCDNCCAQGCAQGCCCWCVEKCLRYINTYAYCVVAISGKNFCTSAKKSYYILVSNTFKLSAMNSVCHLVMLITKVAVMAATTAVSVIWFKSQEDLHFYAIPVLVVAVFSYYIAHCFLSVYQVILDALMLCYCEDRDMNDGSLERPFCGSKGFMIHMAECSQAFNDLVRSQQRSSSEPESEPAQV
uniref:Choline transporter-like protein n=1 Tax=Biomphalaria glabrata TaxID=6526 RepID=A0A2C9JWL6_BIOGL